MSSLFPHWLAFIVFTSASAEDELQLLQLETSSSMKAAIDCVAGFENHRTALRSAGFDIPQNGEHHPEIGIEGGVNNNEFEYLVKTAKQVMAKKSHARICQTGFNYGTSAFAFLCASDASVISWDIGDHSYVNKSSELIDRKFPGRHQLLIGDSTRTLKEAAESLARQCDVVFVDGGHTYDVASSDIKDFGVLAQSSALVIVDDCSTGKKTSLLETSSREARSRWIPDVTRAFDWAVDSGLISRVAQSPHFEGHDDDRAICIGKYMSSS